MQTVYEPHIIFPTIYDHCYLIPDGVGCIGGGCGEEDVTGGGCGEEDGTGGGCGEEDVTGGGCSEEDVTGGG